MNDIKPEHPRAESLQTRKKLADGFKKGLVTPEGLSAHGRGEAFDYILGEKTTEQAKKAIRAGAAELLLAEKPVFSVNGNVAALVPEEISELSKKTNIEIEVNLFHRSKEREEKIASHLKDHGLDKVLGTEEKHSSEISEIESNRRIVDERGIKAADTVFVPLEDGDRTKNLVSLGKKVITIDLNPMSRTAKSADITITNNIVRAMPLFIKELEKLKESSQEKLSKITKNFDNEQNLRKMLKLMLKRLENLSHR